MKGRKGKGNKRVKRMEEILYLVLFDSHPLLPHYRGKVVVLIDQEEGPLRE